MAYRSAAALLALLLLPLALAAQNAGEWRTYGNDGAYTHYTPLDQIDASNVADLEIVWRWNGRSEEHTSELQSRRNLVCRLLLEKKKKSNTRGEA